MSPRGVLMTVAVPVTLILMPVLTVIAALYCISALRNRRLRLRRMRASRVGS